MFYKLRSNSSRCSVI